MNTPQVPGHTSSSNVGFVSNIAQSEIADFGRNDAMVRSIDSAPSLGADSSENAAPQAPKVELWPFTVKIVNTPEQLAKAVKLRHDAYAKHVPDVAAKLVQAEEADEHDIVLLVESKFDGSALGTIRFRTNDLVPLAVENLVDMPIAMKRGRLAEATRLAIGGSGAGYMVRSALLKAFYTYCVQMKVDYMVITARKPLDRMYVSLDFSDIGNEGQFIPIPYVGDLPHRVMINYVPTIKSRCTAMDHPLSGFFWDTIHPDLHINSDNNSAVICDAPILKYA